MQSKSSLDLSAAFDVVNVGLLVKRMKIIGLPEDITSLVEIWLTERFFYVEVDGVTMFSLRQLYY